MSDQPECTCAMTDPSTRETYGGATEPGSMYEPNPECRACFEPGEIQWLPPVPDSLPWSQPDADPLRDMYEVGEASRKSWPFI